MGVVAPAVCAIRLSSLRTAALDLATEMSQACIGTEQCYCVNLL